MSISSENEVTNGEEKSEGNNSEGSLHDSMEILEEVATDDHFENYLPDDDNDSVESVAYGEPKDIFEMPPMPDTLENNSLNNETPPPPPGGNEFIF